MKKCPFCAEEIQDEAIKCRFCNSFLDAAPGAPAAPGPRAPTPLPGSVPTSGAPPHGVAPFVKEVHAPDAHPAPRTIIYEGVPSWKAFMRYYVVAVLLTAAVITVLVMTTWATATGKQKAIEIGAPVAAMALFFIGVNMYRRSNKVRVTNTVIENERGILSRRIEVLQLWRCRDVRYKQTLTDRIFGIAHIEVFAQDASTPQFQLVGLPASRQLFEQLRDSIDIQRQAKNVYGVVS